MYDTHIVARFCVQVNCVDAAKARIAKGTWPGEDGKDLRFPPSTTVNGPCIPGDCLPAAILAGLAHAGRNHTTLVDVQRQAIHELDEAIAFCRGEEVADTWRRRLCDATDELLDKCMRKELSEYEIATVREQGQALASFLPDNSITDAIDFPAVRTRAPLVLYAASHCV